MKSVKELEDVSANAFLLFLIICKKNQLETKPAYSNTISSCGKIHRHLVGDIVDSGIVLTYRLASLCSLTDLCDNPMP
jgi:hypothetical protein